MQRLVLLNFLAAASFAATNIGFEKYESSALMLTSMGLILLLVGLALWNMASVFVFWGRYKFRAFYPIISFAVAMTLCFQGSRYATHLMLEGTPCSPDSFLTGQAKIDLENAATQALGQSFKNVPIDAMGVLKKYGFRDMEVDNAQSLVTFNYYHMRAWYKYTYTTNKQSPLGSRPPTITEADIHDWSELIRIAKQGDHATADEATRIVFCPSIVYPHLVKTLGQGQMDILKGYGSGQDITAEQKQLVLNALNQQWLPSSRLIENPDVTYERSNHMLHLGGCRMDGFWVVFLINDLLSDGVLVYAGDNLHLKIREPLSPSEQNRVAWAHVGLMNFLYGNLFYKAEHFSDRPLRDGWYFTVE